MAQTSSSLAIGYNVDSLAAVSGSDAMIAGLTSFIGREWTGAVAVLAAGGESAPPRTLALLPVRTGVPCVACLPQADEFTGQRVVASGGDDGSVQLWYLSLSGSSSNIGGRAGADLQHAQAKVQHDAAVVGLACSASAGTQLASASADGTLRLWDCTSLLACTAQLGQPGGPAANSVAWTAEPHTLASAGADGRLCLWDVRQLGGSPAAAAAVGAPALSIAATAAGGNAAQLLVVGDLLGGLSVFDARNCSQPLQQRQLHGDAVHALAAAGGGGGSAHVASGSDDGGIMLLDCARLEASRQVAPARRDNEAPCYVRALAWAGGEDKEQALYRGGWDQVVAPVDL